MRAVTQDRYGGTEQLRLTEVADPVPGAGEVLVRVHAAAVDRGTWHLMTGLPLVARLGIGLRRPKVPVIGRDLAGVVEALGPGVSGVAVGDEVIGTADGSFAELAVVPVSRLARKPAGLSFEAAAVLPISGLTALQAVRDAGRVQPGDRVLVTGASGGVGSYAVQVATAYGAEVTGVCSAAKADLVRSLGATRVIDYATEVAGADGSRWDVVIDLAGLRRVADLRRLLTPRGTLVIAGGESDERWIGGIHRQLAALMWSPFVRQRLTAQLSSENAADLTELVGLVERGDVRPTLDRAYPLADAARAIDDLAAGRVRGKAAITVTTGPATDSEDPDDLVVADRAAEPAEVRAGVAEGVLEQHQP